MKETWKDIEGYEGLYQVSDLGRIKSLSRTFKRGKINVSISERIRKLSFNTAGYYNVCLSKQNKQTVYNIHRLVAFAFVPNPHNKETVNHKNAIKTDNRVENLEWVTHKENMQHAHTMGLIDNTGIRQIKPKNYRELCEELLSVVNFNKLCFFLGLKRGTIRQGTKYHKEVKKIVIKHVKNILDEIIDSNKNKKNI